VIAHIGFEVSNIQASARFYDAVFFALGARRLHASDVAIAYGTEEPVFWLTARNAPAPEYGHVALSAVGSAAVRAAHAAGLGAGGSDDGAPGPRPQYGTYAAYLRDPDGLRVEVVAVGS
jgi:catechol 2,3-dioxygenase-like lactoylglutathione lyase family enzyme